MTSKNQKVKLSFNLLAQTRFDKATQAYVARCPAVDVYTQGDTEDDARAALSEAVTQFIDYCYRQSILDDVLNERGFAPVPEQELAPDGTVATDGEVEVISVVPAEPSYEHEYQLDLSLDLRQPLASGDDRGVGGSVSDCPPTM